MAVFVFFVAMGRQPNDSIRQEVIRRRNPCLRNGDDDWEENPNLDNRLSCKSFINTLPPLCFHAS